jgi:hypothetical protein
VYLKGNSSGSVSLRAEGATSAPVNNVNYTTSYQQFTYTFTANSTTTNLIIGGFGSWRGSEAIYIAFPQANIGSTAKPYFPTTDRLNVPRLTYQNGGGGCPSLLLEKQSTNTSAQSEDFSNWATKINVTTTANYAISPDGTTNATRLQFTGSGFIYGNSGFGQTNGTVYSLSCWAKRNGSGTQSVGFFTNGSGTVDSAWTLTSEYQRFTFTYTAGNSSTVGISGTSGADVTVWGWQFEASSYATSYIPTTSASATRVADACFKTGISSLIGQTEGTLFWDGTLFADNETRRIQMISDNTDTNRILFTLYQNKIEFVGITSGTAGFSIQSNTITTGRYKIAGAYKANDFVLYVNGVQIGTDTSGAVPACSRYDLGQDRTGSLVNTILVNETLISKTRLTNDELVSLTTI